VESGPLPPLEGHDRRVLKRTRAFTTALTPPEMPSLMATWAPDDVEDPFWLCRVDSPPAEGTAQVTWLELADGGPRADGSTHYELGGQQPIEENTFIGPVEGSVGEDGNFVLTKAARDEIDAAIAEATPSSTNSAAPPAAAAAPTQQPIVVAADKPLEFLDEKFAFATCTVEVDQEKAGSKLPFPPKPGFKLTSPRQFHQYVGEHIKDLPGAVQCDEMLDESTELFKASRALIEEIAAEYERWRRHFAEVCCASSQPPHRPRNRSMGLPPPCRCDSTGV
jgi:hypothetical protein